MAEPRTEYYREEQYFRQKLLWLFILGGAAWGWFAFIRQVVLGVPVGDHPASDGVLTFLCLFSGFILPAYFYLLRLSVRVDGGGVRYRFWPLNLKERVIQPADIAACEVRTYRPLAEYGGWGIRYGRGGQAYNVSGDQGVQFVLVGGKHLLLGSQRPRALAAAVKKLQAENMR